MILGVEIENFDVFDKDLAGILIDESISIAKDKAAGNVTSITGFATLMLLSDATVPARPVSWDAFRSFRMSSRKAVPRLP